MIEIKKLVKNWKKTTIILFGILSLAFLLRFFRVLVDQQPVFGDEAIYIRWAQIMRMEPGLRFLPLSDGKQPLFMWVLIPVLKVISNPLFAGRILSVFSGSITLLGVFFLTLILFSSKKLALIASLIYALSPFCFFFDSMALVDPMLSMFGVWVMVFSILTVKYYRLDLAMITGFALGGALLTKSPGVFFSMLIPLSVIFSQWPKSIKRKLTHAIKLIGIFIPTYLIGYGMYNIQRLGVNFHLITSRNQDYIFPISHLWINPKDPFIFHIKEIANWLWILGPGVLVFLLILGVIVGIKKYKKETFYIGVIILFPLLVNSMYAKVFTARYILYTLPFVFILASLFYSFKTRLVKLLKLFLVLFIISSVFSDLLLIYDIKDAKLPKNERSGYLEEWTSGYGIKEVSEFLKLEAKDVPLGKQIVVGTEGYFGTLPDGLQMYVAGIPQITVIGVGLDLKELPKSLEESKKFGNKTYLVINNSRLKGDPEEMNLKLVSAYPKALRTKENKEYDIFGPQEVLYFFEVE
ncbi:MAG TPA: glycosyltransferase family 39 protein [Candidatus Humimicrobiaceae bacterium]|nr:glycosyltransferase family 39 protein [Candidatus Humimicrobiaceae bacterium]